jgi:RsiW-degrading membrane proteinase PrsW (M82 family)
MEGIKFFLAILPVFIFALYVYVHDKEKEPTNLLISSFVFGVLIAIPCMYVEGSLSTLFSFLQKSYVSSLLYVIICIGLVEEGYKFLASYIIFYPNENVNYTFDMIVYTSFIGLGFSFFENLMYLSSYKISLSSVILRAFTAVPVHLSCGIIMGYYLSHVKSQIKPVWKSVLKAIFIPVLIHSLYNYYLIYISTIIKRLFEPNKAIIITYSLLVLILACLFLAVHYVLYKSSIEDKKIRVKK